MARVEMADTSTASERTDPRRSTWSIVGLGAVAVLSAGASLYVAPDLRGVFGAALALVMIAIAEVDAREFIIPNRLTLAALALGLGNAAVNAPDPILGLATAMLRGASFALLLFALRTGYRWLRGHEGLGFGDVKLAGAAGVWLEWLSIPTVIEIAALAAFAFYLAAYVRDRRVRLYWQSYRLPFGMFLAPAIWIGWILQALATSSP
jgi:leader peptidase (prepilin peptidase) / N-methyltransferase